SVISSYDNSPMNFPVLRYADVLLMRAEALNELGRTAEALIPLNQVRDRANLDGLPSGLGKEEFRKAVLKERRLELAFEGQRLSYLMRGEGGQYGLDFLHGSGDRTGAEKRLLYPIPQIETDRNPHLPQNPGD